MSYDCGLLTRLAVTLLMTPAQIACYDNFAIHYIECSIYMDKDVALPPNYRVYAYR